MKNKNLKKIFYKKKVLITGHTGFKGSWLSILLSHFGANILGISNNIITRPSHYQFIKRKISLNSKSVDISKYNLFKKTVNNFRPDFIFHLAAQSLVKKSYNNPLVTWKTNTMGTINLLEILKNYKRKVTVVIITSDKVYRNLEKKSGYKENDLLGGDDPYSGSKAGAELAIRSYWKSFLSKNKNLSLAIARAGNVIGGGDWSDDRLIPDCVKAWAKNKKVILRNPNSTRPWQHVLEAVMGYIILAINLNINQKKNNGLAFNFGPSTKKNYKVINCVKTFEKYWPKIKWHISRNKNFKESSLLKLNSSKALKFLKWKGVLNFEQTIKLTAIWYRDFYKKRGKIDSFNQVKKYIEIFNKKSKIKI